MFGRQEFLEEMAFKPDGLADSDSWGKHLILDFNTKHVGLELCNLYCSPPKLSAQMIQARVIWQLLHRCSKLIVFCRNLSPVASMLFQMCQTGRVNILGRIISGWMNESDFPVITASAARLVTSPIRVCDAREPDTFLNVLFEAHACFDYALCDWNLSAGEKAAAYRMTLGSQIKFFCPGR
jgi:hypothetical protein